MKSTISSLLAAALLGAALPSMPTFAAGAPQPLAEQNAVVSPGALRASMLAAARAGDRIVAVGDRGVVLLSDDNGKTYRQSGGVPTRALLTSISFAPDGKTGWAAGHLGVVIVTHDAGESWQLQRDDLSVDQPLFTTRFTSVDYGFAAGLWSLLLHTTDGGKSWQSIALGDDKSGAKAGGSGPNLLSLVVSAKGTLLIGSEQGVVFRSTDGGVSWVAVHTDNAGTFWACLTLRSGVLLAAGLGGKIYRSTDDGLTWLATPPATRSSITALAQLPSGRVVGVGLDGAMLTSEDDGAAFKASYLPERTELTAVIASGHDTAIVFSSEGPLSPTRGFAASPATSRVATR